MFNNNSIRCASSLVSIIHNTNIVVLNDELQKHWVIIMKHKR